MKDWDLRPADTMRTTLNLPSFNNLQVNVFSSLLKIIWASQSDAYQHPAGVRLQPKNVISAHVVKLRKCTMFTPGDTKGHPRRVSGSKATRAASNLLAASDYQVLEGNEIIIDLENAI